MKQETWFSQSGSPSNPMLILLHGIGADHSMWQPQKNVFAEAGFFVLTPDLLAHGKSPKVESLSLTDWDDQILALLNNTGKDDCVLIGVSMGGVIAQHFAARYPERINKLILSDTFGELKTTAEKLLGFSQVLGFQIYKVLGAKLLARGMASAYKAPHAKLAREYFSRVSLKADFNQLILARKAINQIDVIGQIDGEKTPTLVMVGEDFGQSFIEINRKIHKGIRGSVFKILERSMDPSNLVNPEAFNAEVLSFIAE